jgi:DNA-binding NarL/FixJ family response regulator
VSRLYSKLRVNNRAQALMVAVNQGLLPTADAAA